MTRRAAARGSPPRRARSGAARCQTTPRGARGSRPLGCEVWGVRCSMPHGARCAVRGTWYAVRYARHARGSNTYTYVRACRGACPGHQLPSLRLWQVRCTYGTQEAGTRSPCVQYGGPRDMTATVYCVSLGSTPPLASKWALLPRSTRSSSADSEAGSTSPRKRRSSAWAEPCAAAGALGSERRGRFSGVSAGSRQPGASALGGQGSALRHRQDGRHSQTAAAPRERQAARISVARRAAVA